MKKRGSAPKRREAHPSASFAMMGENRPTDVGDLHQSSQPSTPFKNILGKTAFPKSRLFRKEVDLLQREIEKQTEYLLHPLEFHIITLFVSLVILGIIFRSRGIILYIGIMGAMLLIGSVLHKHGHVTHHVARMLALFIVPAFIAAIFMPDALLLVLLGIFIISFVSSFIIHYWHDRVHKLTQIMVVSVYSRTVSLTAAVLVLVLLPSFVLADAFVSFTYVLATIILPAIFVYFFLSRFMYLYFFDHRHARLDAKRSLHQTVIFTGAFLAIVIVLYAAFASVFYTSHTSRLSDAVDERIRDTAALQKTLEHAPATLRNAEVFKELDYAASLHMSKLGTLHSSIDTKPFTFDMALDDSYFTAAVQYAGTLLSLSQYQEQLFDAKEQLSSAYQRVQESVRGDAHLQNESAKSATLEKRIASLQAATQHFKPSEMPGETLEWTDRLDDPAVPVSYVEKEGLAWLLTRQQSLNIVYRNQNLFEERVFFVLRNTLLFRDTLRLSSHSLLLREEQQLTTPLLTMFWQRRAIDESLLSKTLRLELIAQEAGRLKSAPV
ncbi:hypothetical protein HZB03_02720 [Candidatus Woesearchaeota archaeon]|nr:hypothetical protein [Candidatus Woesearchaeota archaeon]